MSTSGSNRRNASGLPFPSDSDVEDGVFLTPRVLDQTAFKEYSDSLRGLIREAGGKRNELRTDAEAARQLCENMTDAAGRLRERLETTAKLLPTLDNRVRRAEQAIEQATDHANLPARLEEHIGEHIKAMESRVNELLGKTEARLKEAETRYAALHERAQADLSRLETIEATLSASASTAQAHLSQINDRTAVLRSEIEHLAEQSSTRFEEKTESLVARADHAYSTLQDGISGLMAGAQEQLNDLEEKIAPLTAKADEIPLALEEQVQRAVEMIDAHAADTIKRVQAIEMLSQRAVRLLGFDPSDPGDEIAPDSLMMLIQRGDELERSARETATELAALHSVNDDLRTRCARTVDQAAGAIEGLVARRDELIASVERTLSSLGEDEPAFLNGLLSARDQLSEIESRRAEVESGVGSVGEELSRLESAVTEQLSSLRAQAADELSRLQVAVAAQRRSMAQLVQPAPIREGTNGNDLNAEPHHRVDES